MPKESNGTEDDIRKLKKIIDGYVSVAKFSSSINIENPKTEVEKFWMYIVTEQNRRNEKDAIRIKEKGEGITNVSSFPLVEERHLNHLINWSKSIEEKEVNGKRRVNGLMFNKKYRIYDQKFADVYYWIDNFVLENGLVSSYFIWLLRLRSIFNYKPEYETTRMKTPRFVEKKRPDYMTAANSPYYFSLQEGLRSLHKMVSFKSESLYLMDLGLNAQHLKQTRKYCKCEILKNDYKKYNKDVGNLKHFSWKIMMINEYIHKFGFFFYGDTSIKYLNIEVPKTWEKVKDIGMLSLCGTHNDASSAFMHPDQLKTLGPMIPRYQLSLQVMAGGNLLVYDNLILRIILKFWLSCAFDQKCIGNRYGNCHMGERLVRYNGCPRFDQSAINLITNQIFQIIPILWGP
ncbi:hypothetical protein SNEBB_004151 [Seison nebaliae]|nr:hypothetical protein SNEBB_004151 [Seison nebaliae]